MEIIIQKNRWLVWENRNTFIQLVWETKRQPNRIFCTSRRMEQPLNRTLRLGWRISAKVQKLTGEYLEPLHGVMQTRRIFLIRLQLLFKLILIHRMQTSIKISKYTSNKSIYQTINQIFTGSLPKDMIEYTIKIRIQENKKNVRLLRQTDC